MSVLRKLFQREPDAIRPAGDAKSAEVMSHRAHVREDGVRTSIDVKAFVLEPLEGGRIVQVVGESFYLDALERIAGGRSEESTRMRVTVVLYPEPDRPYDSSAVGVYVEGQKGGHLSREDAAIFQPRLLRLFEEARLGTCDAQLKGGWLHANSRGEFWDRPLSARRLQESGARQRLNPGGEGRRDDSRSH